MAQIRSKQIADFLDTVNWATATSNNIASATAIKSYVDGRDNSIGVDITSLENALSSEVFLTDGEINDLVSSVDSIELALGGTSSGLDSSIDSLENALSSEVFLTDGEINALDSSVDSLETALSAEINSTNSDITALNSDVTSINTRTINVENDVNAILAGSSADKDSFAEIVSLINQVDTTNDQTFASYVTSNNASVDSLETALSNEVFLTDGEINVINSSVDSLETALSAEINSTNNDISGINSSINSLETSLSAEINSTDSDINVLSGDVNSIDTRVSSIEQNLGGNYVAEGDFAQNTFVGSGNTYTLTSTPANDFTAFDAFVNGIKVTASFSDTSGFPEVTLSPGYTIDSNDEVVIKYIIE